MGSSGEDPNKGIDATVGGLVWVCRRNGSWWPGRILGPDELSEGCMPTSRPGTPIKLLGRDDAIVDWYNLEKSKRVKAFRCGQFDYCIEKAKESSTTSHLFRKSIKYARREDAILEALELESARLDLDQPNFSVKHDESSIREENEDDSESVHELSLSGISFNEQGLVDTIKKGSKGSITLNNSDDDDGSEGVKRMRGIEDLGMGIASKTKRKGSLKGAKGHEFLKRKSRSRPLTKVLEVSLPVVCKESSALESHDSKKKNSVVINTSDSTTGVSCENATSLAASMHGSDVSLKSSMLGNRDDVTLRTLFDVPINIAENKNSAGFSKIITGPSQTSQHGPAAQSSQSSHVETISLRNEEPNDSNSTSSGTANINTISHTINKTTSEWQLKGKRNSRSRKTEIDDEAETRSTKSRSIAEIQLDEFPGWSINAHRRELSHTKRPADDLSQRLLPYRHSRFTVNPKYDSSGFPLRNHVNGSGLYEVNIEVKASCRPQGVPYISLMSKLNGRPVLGNPVEIEVLEDGFCDGLLNFPRYYKSTSEFDYNVDKVYGRRKPRGRAPAKRGLLRAGKSLKKKKCLKPKKDGKSGLLSKKMRKLSSLSRMTVESEGEEKKLITEKVNPVIACVPLNVVFSRINADLSNSMRFPAPSLGSNRGV